MLILNSGGTFNKRYNHISGNLEVPRDNLAVEKVLELTGENLSQTIIGVIFKDSLEMTDFDRELLLKTILESNEREIIVIHGTDTIDLSAKFLSENIDDRKIVFVGAMKPISIDPIDGALNFGIALGFLKSNSQNGIYISMSGLIKDFNAIKKDRENGIFREIER